eukprot:Hpha_TRINITY_DN30073_c0_g1::TRINITY_DN30073_c0_g1_i1::g.21555::m.21555
MPFYPEVKDPPRAGGNLSAKDEKALEKRMEQAADKLREDFQTNGERRISHAMAVERMLQEGGRMGGRDFSVSPHGEEDHPDQWRPVGDVPGSPGYKAGEGKSKPALKDARQSWPPECASPDRSTVKW